MTRAMIVIGFVFWFGAGLAVGWRVAVPDEQNPNRETNRSDRGSWLAQQLDLTVAQQEQMKEIWSDVASRRGRESAQRRMELRRERDRAIADLVPESQREAYDQIHADYTAAMETMEAEWRASFQQAVANTRAMLTPEQLEKYDAITARHDMDRTRERGRPSRRSGSRENNETQPAQ